MSDIKNFQYHKLPAELADDDTPPPPSPPSKEEKKKKKRGMVRGCCLPFVLITFGIFSVIAFGAGLFGYVWLRRTIPLYTVKERVELPIEELTDSDHEALSSRLDHYRVDLKHGNNPGDVYLTAHELNGMIADSEFLRGNVFVTMDDGVVKAEVSMPMPHCLPGGKGRFFVGVATFVLTDQSLTGSVQTPPLKAWDGPGPFAAAMLGYNFNKAAGGGDLSVWIRSAELMGEEMPLDDIDDYADLIGPDFYEDEDSERVKAVRLIESFAFHKDEVVIETKGSTHEFPHVVASVKDEEEKHT